MLPEQRLETEREQFVIDTKEKASWALRKLAKIKKAMDENKAIADAEIKRTQEWLAKENEYLQQDEDYFINLLNLYHASVLEEDPKAKTIKLPFGTLKARDQQPEYVRDEEKLLLWAKAKRPDMVKVKESVDWATLKKTVSAVQNGVAIDENGQPIDGVTVLERGVKLSVEVDVDGI